MPLESTDSLNQNLTRNLRLVYQARRTTLVEFSRELGIGHSTLRNILHGQGNSTLSTVEQIAQSLGVAPQVLLTGQHTEDRLLSALLLLEAVDCRSRTAEAGVHPAVPAAGASPPVPPPVQRMMSHWTGW